MNIYIYIHIFVYVYTCTFHVYSDLYTRLAAKFVESRYCAAAYSFQLPTTCTDRACRWRPCTFTDLDPTRLYISICRTYSDFARENRMPAVGGYLLKSYSCASSRVAASRSHLKCYHRTIGSFQLNEFDEMTCKLDSTDYGRSFESNPTLS